MYRNYSDQVSSWLKELNYTHCFFLGGGNCMHLVEAASHVFETIPVIHEVSAGIAAEYFTDLSVSQERAFALVTAGPGVTNIVSAVSGAWLESRPLLIIAGQAKTTNLSTNGARQIGHQEVSAVEIMKPITKKSFQINEQISKNEFQGLVTEQFKGRPGPVFIEICLDITAMPPIEEKANETLKGPEKELSLEDFVNNFVEDLQKSKRPMILIGGGVSRDVIRKSLDALEKYKIPLSVTWNGADRVGSDYRYFCGRPNTYGMRYANVLIQQSDLLLTLGTRLGIQQVGFAWEKFAENAKKYQVEIDKAELEKGFPKIHNPINGNANDFLLQLTDRLSEIESINWNSWLDFIDAVKKELPKVEPLLSKNEAFVNPYELMQSLNERTGRNDILVSCSSGGTFTAFMQVIEAKGHQKICSSKGLASMGFGLAGAIGAAIANPNERIVLTEGDGGFAQNLQELGTLKYQDLNVKIFLFDNDGYASIRTSQKSYFSGHYLGCDSSTGLGMPNWQSIFSSYGIESLIVTPNNLWDARMKSLFEAKGPVAFIIQVDPEQTYLPKVTSKILENGQMVSNPIHLMFPEVSDEKGEIIFKYFNETQKK